MSSRPTREKSVECGFSLIELMVALTIGALIGTTAIAM